MVLKQLQAPVDKLPGVGPAMAGSLHSMGIFSIHDLLLLCPRHYEDRLNHSPLPCQITDSPTWVNTIASVVAHDFFIFNGKQTLKVYINEDQAVDCQDSDHAMASACLVCFGRNYLADAMPVGKTFHICGQFSFRYGDLQSSNFDFAPLNSDNGRFNRILPIYPLAGRLGQKTMRNIIGKAMQQYGQHVESSLPPAICQATAVSLKQLHMPEELAAAELARRQLALEELFFLQLEIALSAQARSNIKRPPSKPSRRIQQEVIAGLPYTLTDSQLRTIQEIYDDMCSDRPMRRLLQGDVGSGKTIAAVLSALPVLQENKQAVIMVPTELLAQQHFQGIKRVLGQLEIGIQLLTGSLGQAERQAALEALQNGDAKLIIGTHAVFSSDVHYNNLAYVIIDEQHRFGVTQRQALIDKAAAHARETQAHARDPQAPRPAAAAATIPDILFMTATPIPRTLAQTAYGDLVVSTIDQNPAGRLPVMTHLARMGNEAKVYNWVRQELQRGRQAIFVYPMIQEGKTENIKDASSMYARLAKEIFPDYKTALLHSRIDHSQKTAIMQDFAQNKIHILAATSVVEVGIDIPNATCMVIEHAERFGLSALHQLRGRVGRGHDQAYCFLVYAEPLTEEAKARIMTMKEHSDGFAIAEEDLRQRGYGELAGKRQSGFWRLQIARLPDDTDIMEAAHRLAWQLAENDPSLASPDNQMIVSSLEAMRIQEDISCA